MDIQTLWLIVLAVSTPIAGVVGFAIQLRSTKKLRLENEKLQLEISELTNRVRKANQLIIEPTNEEVEKYSHPPVFMRIKDRSWGRDHEHKTEHFSYFKLTDILLVCIVASFFGYLVYDIYRLFSWLWGLL